MCRFLSFFCAFFADKVDYVNNIVKLSSYKEVSTIITRIRKNKLNSLTIAITVFASILYLIGFVILIKRGHGEIEIIRITADYMTIYSCVVILLQLIAFVRDTRFKELRSKKEAALDLAKEYATDILPTLAFIEGVIADNNNKTDRESFTELISKEELKKFTYDELKTHTVYMKYANIFKNSQSGIEYNTIVNEASMISDNEKKALANFRFRSLLSDTLNVLEYFSMSVNQNVSDSAMLYEPLHITYIRFVHYIYPYICYRNKENCEETCCLISSREEVTFKASAVILINSACFISLSSVKSAISFCLFCTRFNFLMLMRE